MIWPNQKMIRKESQLILQSKKSDQILSFLSLFFIAHNGALKVFITEMDPQAKIL